MKEIKRAVCLMLCFVMVFGLLPVHALALDFGEPELQPGEFLDQIPTGDAQEEIVETTATGNLPGGTNYVLDRNGVDPGAVYLIVSGNNGNVHALRNKLGSAEAQSVSINNDIISSVNNESQCIWTFTQSGSSWNIKNGSYYVRMGTNSLLSTSIRNLGISHEDKGAYYITYSGNYLRYVTDSGKWEKSTAGYVYLFKQTTAPGTSVEFNVTPAASSLKPGENKELTTEIKLGSGDLESFEITWGTENASVATVDNGVVRAEGNGTTNITATLSKVNGMSLEKDIVVSVTVTVADREIISHSLSGNAPVTIKKGGTPDFSKIKLTLTYSEGPDDVITVNNGLIIEGYDVNEIGDHVAKISYNGTEYGTVLVTVDGNPYEGLDEATDYPKYPEDGAVRIDKHATELNFADTGLVQVELNVAGVSVKGAVDVILVTDLSNSMARPTTDRNNDGKIDDNDCPADYTLTKVYDLAVSVGSFADTFLADENGTATRNTLSLVTFGGYDADHTKKVYTAYADPTQTLVLGTKDADTIKNAVNNIRVMMDDHLNLGTSSTGFYLSFDGGKTYGENYGNTNYDHAFMQTADAIAALKKAYEDANEGTYAESGRQIYVIFMTDGAPSNYDGVYYNYKTGDRADVNCTWVNANGQEVTYTMGNNNKQYSQADWFKYIAGSAYNATTQTITGNPLYWADQVYSTPGVADIISVGFDLDHGGFAGYSFTEEAGTPLAKVLEKLVTGKTLTVHSADDQAGMKEIYEKLATKLRYAGTSANVEDVIDPDFTLQMDSITGTAGQGIDIADVSGYDRSITIKAYDLWTKDETDDISKIGTRQKDNEGNLLVENIETVTFETLISYDKDNKEIRTIVATSDKKPGESNILSTATDGTVTINAAYFTYIKTPAGVETFKWKIGNITDKEIALSYLAYLKGSLEGLEENGLKYTNKEATLDYIDINGKHAQQIFPIPAVAWGGASTAYEFYLVNDAGEPCDRLGNAVPFANRIIITGPYFQELYLNQGDQEVAKDIVAIKVLPAGYTLYDDTAKYSVQTASGTHKGKLVISEPAAGKVQTTKLVSAVTPSYIQSRVAFGVIYNLIPDDADFTIDPDAVVIDYGKKIIIDVNANNDIDKDILEEYTVTLIGFSKFYDDVDVNQKFTNTPYSAPFEGTYGTFSLTADNKVSYVPHRMVNNVGKIFCVYKVSNKSNDKDVYYMVSELDVIPATIMYYETDFADWYENNSDNKVPEKVFALTGFGTTKEDKEFTNDNIPTGNVTVNPQDDGTIGQNTYGYDSSYNDDVLLSNGTSLYAEGMGYESDGKSKTYATFSFTGTGFDLISRTGTAQGLIKVQVATDANMTNIVKTVSVLNKSESDLELYQIPVVSINNLEHRTYYVKVEVDKEFTHPLLSALDRGNQFFFDAVRIYDPAKGNEIAETAYNADGEANNNLDEVRALLLDADTYATIEGETTGMVFIDRTQGDVEVSNGNPEVATYQTIGPNNEVYLSKGQAVAFHVDANKDPASFDIGAKSITGSPAGLCVTVRNLDGSKSWTVTQEIASSTVQFIDLLSATGASAAMLNSGAYVVITNTTDGVLSITDLKTAFQSNTASIEVDTISGVSTMTNGKIETYGAVKPEVPFCVSYTVDSYTLDVARMVLNGEEPEAPEVPEEPEIPENPEIPDVDPSFFNIQNARVQFNGSTKNPKCTFTVVTSQKVEEIEIVQNGTELNPGKITFKDKKNGERTWTIEFYFGGYDKNGAFILTGIGETGVRGESVVVNNVKRR